MNDYSLYSNNFWYMDQKYHFLEYEKAYVIMTQQKKGSKQSTPRDRG